MTHRHACPDCGHDWECDSPAGTPCANQAANGNPARLCDLCWGMAKPARSDPKVARINEKPASSAWARRAAATGGGPCPTCGKPFWTHVCLSCSPDNLSPGPGCVNCRNTGMDQTPCLPDRLTRRNP